MANDAAPASFGGEGSGRVKQRTGTGADRRVGIALSLLAGVFALIALQQPVQRSPSHGVAITAFVQASLD
jgi:hypothetical protein